MRKISIRGEAGVAGTAPTLITSIALASSLLLGTVTAGEPDLDQRLEREKLTVQWLGTVRHFHPTEAVEETDWQAVHHHAMELARDSDSGPHFHAAISALLAPLTVGMQIVEAGEPVDEPILSCRDGAAPVRWDHKGFDAPPARPLPFGQQAQGIYQSKRAPWPVADTGIDESEVPTVYRLAIGAGREVLIPLALCPEQSEMNGEESPYVSVYGLKEAELSWSDKARLAVVSLWPALRYFYPYPEVVEPAWHIILTEALLEADEVRDRAGMSDLLATLSVPLNDGHLTIRDEQNTRGDGHLPLGIHWNGGQPVIIHSPDREALPTGSKITHIDGESLDDWRRRDDRRRSGSEQWIADAQARSFLRGQTGEEVMLSWRKGEESGEHHLAYEEESFSRPLTRQPLDELADGIAYVDLRAVEDDMIADMLSHLEGREAAILDLRGYPAGMVGFRIIAHLIEEDAEHWPDWMRIMTPRAPGDLVVREVHGWPIRPVEPRVDAEIVVLMDGGAISYAESVLGMLKFHGLATLVGSPSAGANGNIMALEAPGDFTILKTGMRVIGPDGGIFQGRGIQPHVHAEATVDGLLAGEDEVLKAGLRVLKERQ